MREGFDQTGNIRQTSTGYLQLASGTTAQRPTANNGMIRYNTDTSQIEFYSNGWANVASTSFVANNYLPLTGGTITGNLLMTTGQIEAGSGTATTPSYSFSGDTNTGIYHVAADQMSFVANGISALTVQAGSGTNASIVATSTDALTLPIGNTAQRPSVVTNGMIRYNSALGISEIYQTGTWSKVGTGDVMYNTTVQQITIANVASGPILFAYDPARGKTLSIETLTITFENPAASDLSWIYVDPNMTNANYGYGAPLTATLVALQGFTQDITYNKYISLYVNNTEYANALVFPATSIENAGVVSASLSIDVNYGDKIRTRLRAPDAANTNLGAISLTCYFSFRAS